MEAGFHGTCSCGHCLAAVKWRNTMWTILGLVSKDLKTLAKKNGTSRCCLATCQDKETCRFLGTRGHVKGIFLLSKAHQNILEDLFIYLFCMLLAKLWLITNAVSAVNSYHLKNNQENKANGNILKLSAQGATKKFNVELFYVKKNK